jgi:hydrogenase maturation protein HypF
MRTDVVGPARSRRALLVSGVVQGVGFRPFVHGLAARLGLAGFVRNQTDGVLVEIEGDARALDRFVDELARDAPPLARVERVTCAAREPRGEREFRIVASAPGASETIAIAPDAATCDACLAELFDPRDRRHGYAFINCTSCGPRLTIITGAPYDRARTTMAGFAMCDACRGEYDDPRDRRFHAQPNACPECGPRLRLGDGDSDGDSDSDGARSATDANDLAVIERAVARLRAGAIVAVKGLGGYHLACDARDDDAVARLRARKLRDEKPLAVLAADFAAAARLCEWGADARALLESPGRPIVLAPRRADAAVAAAIAPGLGELGVMLPYTPLHHLLARAARAPLVLTSGNRSDEPIAFDDADARARLAGIADLFVTHDRPIRLRCDDSVARVVDGAPVWLRRSRGLAPLPVALPEPLALPTLAVGGELKSTFALGDGARALLSHHLGDLEHYAAYVAFTDAIAHYEALHRLTPARLVHDLHPEYASTRYARERAARDGVPAIAVQHHHAHLAAALAEHGARGPAIGVCFDGAGFGTDGAIWGGEFLVGDAAGFVRAAHLAYVPLVGGERAMREPWRVAVAHLRRAGCELGALGARIDRAALRVVETMRERGVNAPLTSSAGRLFDAAAAIAGACDAMSFEAQAAMRLEALAARATPDGEYPFALDDDGGRDDDDGRPLVIDPAPILRALAEDARRGVAPELMARRFHATIAALIAAMCARLAARFGVRDVALTGGVFANAILSSDAAARLARAGLRVLRHRVVPPGDGGLSLGQLAVAAARDRQPPAAARDRQPPAARARKERG